MTEETGPEPDATQASMRPEPEATGAYERPEPEATRLRASRTDLGPDTRNHAVRVLLPLPAAPLDPAAAGRGGESCVSAAAWSRFPPRPADRPPRVCGDE